MAPSLYRLTFAYSNLLKLELGIDYLFKTNNSNNHIEFKGYWASLQRRSLLVQHRKGTTIGRSWPYLPFASVPKYLQVGNKQCAANRDRVIILPWLISAVNFVSTSDRGLRRFCPCYHKICMCMRMHECFQTQQILVKDGLGSILIKCLGHPMNRAKGLRWSQTNTRLKTSVRTETSNPCSLL